MNEWKIASNIVGDKKLYGVYRVIDPSQPVHSSNMEYYGGYMESRESAKTLADQLNAEERDKAILGYLDDVNAYLDKLIGGEYESVGEIMAETERLMKEKDRLMEELGIDKEDREK